MLSKDTTRTFSTKHCRTFERDWPKIHTSAPHVGLWSTVLRYLHFVGLPGTVYMPRISNMSACCHTQIHKPYQNLLAKLKSSPKLKQARSIPPRTIGLIPSKTQYDAPLYNEKRVPSMDDSNPYHNYSRMMNLSIMRTGHYHKASRMWILGILLLGSSSYCRSGGLIDFNSALRYVKINM